MPELRRRIAGDSRRTYRFETLEARCVLSAAPIITEFVASNDNSLDDGDGRSSDWVEIYNPTSQTIDLAGWHLTDKADNLDKWTFPSAAQSLLSPGEYLVVFASGQDTETYIDPLGYLHTDFALSAGGEFLALTDPAENIIWSYSPEFPQQLTDVSYGVNTSTVALIDESSGAAALAPDSGVLDTGPSPAWTQVGFDDSAWASSPSGPAAGFDSSQGHDAGPADGVEVPDLVGGDLTDPEDDGVLAVEFFGGSSSNSPSGEEPARALDNTRGTKWLAFAPGGTFYDIDFLDGQPRVIDGYTISSANDAPNRDPYSWTLSGSNDGEAYTVIDSRDAQNFAGRFETRLYEFVNTTPYSHYRFDFQTEYGVTGANQPVAIQMAEIELFSSQAFNLDSIIDLDVQSEWDAHQSSLYHRIPFQVDDPADLGALTLDLQYNDGFVSYLNGVQVAAANSPASPNWQSHALAEREDGASLTPESFDLSAFHHLLTAGENVLAIHALNATDASSELLSSPRLTAVSLAAGPSEEYYFETPTPGATNGEGRFGFVDAPAFSVERGFYDAGFQLTLTSAPEAAVYYTTNGDAPSPETGLLYTGPITVDATTVIKAGAFRPGYYDSPVATHSYLFVKDVVSQSYSSTLAAGFPTSWGGVSPDYGMDPDVIGYFDAQGVSLGGDLFGGEYAATIQDDLLAIPTLSIVMNTDDLFGPSGIYTQSTNGGVAYERATSVELINPDGSPGFQVDAGIRIQGGAFRRHDLSKKHSLRLLFKDEYGPTKLDFPLFGDDAVDSFDTVTLRMESNDGYAWNGAGTKPQYARDAFGSRTMAALGNVSPHGNRMHLYINGVYWGVYNPNERPDASFAAMYYGGDKDNWDAINDGSPIDGDLDAWNEMIDLAYAAGSGNNGDAATQAAFYQRLQGNNPDGTNNPAYEDYLDVDNYIDYLLVNFYMGNVDWPHRNWYAARERGPDSTGFKFHSWDAESTLNLFGSNINTNRLGADVEAAQAYSYLRDNADFRLKFADRVHRALFNDGALTTAQAVERYEAILSEMDDAIIAESARWGDMHRSTPLTKAEWVAEGESVVNTFLNGRTEVFIQQLQAAGLYRSLSAPEYSQHGGSVPVSGQAISIAHDNTQGSVYYTLDGSDPRGEDGTPAGVAYSSPVTVTPGATLLARTYYRGGWSALNAATYTAPPLPGDYNGDQIVDDADYDVWRANYGGASSAADGNGDGVVNAADYAVWRDNYGATAVPASPAPELATAAPAVAVQQDPTSARPAQAPLLVTVSVDAKAERPADAFAASPAEAAAPDDGLLLLLAERRTRAASSLPSLASRDEASQDAASRDAAFSQLSGGLRRPSVGGPFSRG